MRCSSLISVQCSSCEICLESSIQMRLIQLIAMNFKFDARGSLIGKSREAEMTPKIGQRMRLSDCLMGKMMLSPKSIA